MKRMSVGSIVVSAGIASFGMASAAEFSANRMFVTSYASGAWSAVEFARTQSAPYHVATGSSVGGGSSSAIAWGPDGLLYVGTNDGFAVIDANGSFVDSASGFGVAIVSGIAFGPTGDVYVVSFGSNAIVGFSRASGQWMLSSVHLADGATGLAGVAFSSEGSIYASDNEQGRIYEVRVDSYSVRSFSTGHALDQPWHLAFGADGLLYVAMFRAQVGANLVTDRVYAFTTNGARVSDQIGAGSGMSGPSGIAFGPNGNLYVSSSGSDDVTEFDAVTFTEIAAFGNQSLNGPSDIAFVPQRFAVKLAGSLMAPGTSTRKLKESAIMSIAPGSRAVMVALVNDDLDGGGLAEQFDSQAWVLRGFETAKDELAATRSIGGAQSKGSIQGHGSMSLTTKGKVEPNGNYSIKSINGALGLHGVPGSFIATVKSSKLLNKPVKFDP